MKILFPIICLALVLTSCAQRTAYYTRVEHATKPIVQRKWVESKPQVAAKPTHAHKHEHENKKAHIVIDAGHGGKDTGALSVKNGYEEKERTLLTAKIVKTYLEQMGYRVTMTRKDDTFISLEKRAEIANHLKAALFVSLHYNYCDSSDAHGIEIFYYKDEKHPLSPRIVESKRLGEEVLSRITKHTGAYGRGVKRANFAVVRETHMPAILIEGGFLSNPSELGKIKEESYLCYLGWGIAKGIDSYITSAIK